MTISTLCVYVQQSRPSLFRDLINTKEHWLRQVRQLDQLHAPNLPLHVDPRSLSSDQLREMVIKAVQTYENCHSDPFGRGSITTSLNLADPGPDPKYPRLDGTLHPPFMSLGHKLVPGGKYVFVHWSHGND